MSFRNVKALLLILLFGSIVRLVALDVFPYGMHNDEASFIYNARLIKQTGMDEDGRTFPIFLNSFIDPKPALISYFQVLSFSILGESLASARMVHSLFGVGSLLLIYLLVLTLTKDSGISLITTGLVTISPWHLMISRGTQEVIVSFFFGILSIFLLLRWSPKRVGTYVILILGVGLTAILSAYLYHSSKVVVPLLLLLTLVWKKQEENYRTGRFYFTGGLIVLLLFGLLVYSSGLDRFQSVSIFSQKAAENITGEQIRVATGQLPIPIIRMFHNKIVNYSVEAFGNYISHFDLSFLLFDTSEPRRYSVPQYGLLYLSDILLLIFGVVVVLIDNQATVQWRRIHLYMIGWLLVAPLPAALTFTEIPSSIRSFYMIVPIAWFMSQGIYFLWNNRSTFVAKLGLGFVCMLFFGQGLYYANQALVQAPYFVGRYRNSAEEDMGRRIADYDAEVQRVVIENYSQPYIYLGLNNRFDMNEIITSKQSRLTDDYTLGKYRFVKDSCPLGKRGDVLYVVHEGCVRKATSVFDDIDSETVFIRKNQLYQLVTEFQHTHGSDGYVALRWMQTREVPSAE